MICDKCDKEVKPQNNALLYDAVLSALSTGATVPILTGKYWDDHKQKYEKEVTYQVGYYPQVTWGGFAEFDVFQKGEIVPGNPQQSIRNVLLKNHRNGRHLYGTASCEGSPSRRRTIEEGVWGNGIPMGDLAEVAKQSYKMVMSLKTPAPVHQ